MLECAPNAPAARNEILGRLQSKKAPSGYLCSTLANFGVGNPLADSTLDLVNRTNAVVGSNNDWGSTPALCAAATLVGAFQLTPGSRDAAVQVSVATGAYTAVVGGGTPAGNALIELYDTETASMFTARITNISTRGRSAQATRSSWAS